MEFGLYRANKRTNRQTAVKTTSSSITNCIDLLIYFLTKTVGLRLPAATNGIGNKTYCNLYEAFVEMRLVSGYYNVCSQLLPLPFRLAISS